MTSRTAKTTVLLIVALSIVASFWGCGGPPKIAGLSARQLYDQGIDKYDNGKYLHSIELFQAIVYNYPGESLIDTAQYYLALSYYGNKDYGLATIEFNRLLINYPASVYATQAQLMKAVAYFEGIPENYGLDQSELPQAIQQFEDFLIDHPEADATEEAKAYLNTARTRLAQKYYASGVVYTRVRDYRASRIYFQKVIDDFTDTEFAALATYEIAEGDFQSKKWDDAHEEFEKFSLVFSEHELAPKAAERMCEASYKGGENAFEKGDFGLAKTRLDRYLLVCGDDEGKVKKANEWLELIGDVPVVETEGDHAGS